MAETLREKLDALADQSLRGKPLYDREHLRLTRAAARLALEHAIKRQCRNCERGDTVGQSEYIVPRLPGWFHGADDCAASVCHDLLAELEESNG